MYPVVGNWYQHQQKGQRFLVLAVLNEEELIEIQYFDGSIDQIEFDEWPELNAQRIEAPEDWTGPIDNVEHDDLGYDETAMSAADWDEAIGEQRTRRLRERGDAEDSEAEGDEGSSGEEPTSLND